MKEIEKKVNEKVKENICFKISHIFMVNSSEDNHKEKDNIIMKKEDFLNMVNSKIEQHELDLNIF